MDPDNIGTIGRAAHGGSDDADVIDFSANTNPRVPADVKRVYVEALEASRAYPPEPPERYREAAAAYANCEPSQVVPMPGGLAAIRLAIECTVHPGDDVLVPFPSFSEYAREVRLQGASPTFVRSADLLEAEIDQIALAIVCNPNNPTGHAYDVDALQRFAAQCREAGTPVLVDEAFIGFTERPSLAGSEGVIVARSLTKLFGLPGLRAGFAVATDELLERLISARRPWNVDTPARIVGTYCMRQDDFVDATRKRVRSERERMRTALSEWFEVAPSEAPYLLLDIGDRDVEDFITQVRDRGIAVRDATTFRGLNSHVRVAVRLPEENDRLLSALKDV